MQAPTRWAPPEGTLGAILAETRGRVAALRERRLALERAAERAPPAPRLADALRGPAVAIVAEVKRRSPSRGAINPGLSARDQAIAYARGGAAALSVLTEPNFFGGAAADLDEARGAVSIPLLKKDFHVDIVQLLEARSLGASAALVIARALPPDALAELVRAATDIGLEALVEVRDEGELERALAAGAVMIGVNNRDLETLVLDHGVGRRVLPAVPAECVAVSESGVITRQDVEAASAAGADAVLVGSSVSAARDPASAVRDLTGVRVSRDHRH